MESCPEAASAYFVDQVGGNFLFRGATPDQGQDGSFDIDWLRGAIADAAKAAKISLPGAYYLIDVNLLQTGNPSEVPMIGAEWTYFRDNSAVGQVQYWSTEGTGIDPVGIPSSDVFSYLLGTLGDWLGDPLLDRIATLRGWLDGSVTPIPAPPAPPPPAGMALVVYVHCVGGCDRTGEVIGSYSLHYLGLSWAAMNAANKAPCGGNMPFGCDNYFATRWYAAWLNAYQGFSIDWQQPPFGDCPPCNEGGGRTPRCPPCEPFDL